MLSILNAAAVGYGFVVALGGFCVALLVPTPFSRADARFLVRPALCLFVALATRDYAYPMPWLLGVMLVCYALGTVVYVVGAAPKMRRTTWPG